MLVITVEDIICFIILGIILLIVIVSFIKCAIQDFIEKIKNKHKKGSD